MPPPRTTDHDDEELVRYVLGLLPDEARERLDEASIVNDEVAARLRHAETDLIDNYVRGQLSGATLERFESYYLSSPHRREKVRLAASVLSAVDRSVARAEPASWRDRVASGQVHVARFRGDPRDRGIWSLPLRGGAASERVDACDLRKRGSRAAVPQSRRPLRPLRCPPRQAGNEQRLPERVVAVVLPPPTRAVAPIPTLAIPAGVDRVRFELQLETNDFPSYRVGLKDPATNRILWRSDWIVPRSSADQASILRGRAREPARATALFARSRRPRRRRPRGGDRELHRAGRAAMIRAAHLSCAFITLAALHVRPSAAQSDARQVATAIDAGASIERHVAVGEEHLYRITLAAGQYAEVIVEQRGIDVVVQARREGATDHVEFQEEVRRDGQERVEVVADDGGAYILAIAPSHGIYSGTYAIRVATRRAATDSDRSMYEARRLRTGALALAKAARFKRGAGPLRTCNQHQRNCARAR